MKLTQTLAILAAGLLALASQAQAQTITEQTVQVATIGGLAYKGGIPVLKGKVDLKTVLASAGVTAPKSRVLVLSTCEFKNNGKTATRYLLALRKVPGGTLTDDINVLDLSSINDYLDPVNSTLPSAFDANGNGFAFDNVSVRSGGGTTIQGSTIFSGSGGVSLTKFSKGIPFKAVFDIRMEGTINGGSAVLLFKVGAGKLYVPKP